MFISIFYIWFLLLLFSYFAMLFGAVLITPEKKWYIIIIYLILGVVFEIFLFIDPSASIEYVNPLVPGEDLINDSLEFGSIPGILVLIFLLSILIFDGIGFLRKGIQSTGIIRKKFILLFFGVLIYIVGGILDGLFSPGIALIFIRSAMALSAVLFYLGVKQ